MRFKTCLFSTIFWEIPAPPHRRPAETSACIFITHYVYLPYKWWIVGEVPLFVGDNPTVFPPHPIFPREEAAP